MSKLILLDTKHIDSNAVRRQLAGTEGIEELSLERKTLRNMRELAQQEFVRRKNIANKEEKASKRRSYRYLYWRSLFFQTSEYELKFLDYQYLAKLKELRARGSGDNWEITDDEKSLLYNRDEYISTHASKEQLMGRVFLICLFLLHLVPFMDRFSEKAFASCFGILGLTSLIYLIWSIRIQHKFFDKSHMFESKLLTESFGPVYPETDSASVQHLNFLGLGQFFQTTSHLYRLIGFVDGPNHVLMLRKSIRGTSELVEDFIDRFSTPTLVALTIQEFCDVYSGEDLNKSDHWWTSRIISPSENWT